MVKRTPSKQSSGVECVFLLVTCFSMKEESVSHWFFASFETSGLRFKAQKHRAGNRSSLLFARVACPATLNSEMFQPSRLGSGWVEVEAIESVLRAQSQKWVPPFFTPPTSFFSPTPSFNHQIFCLTLGKLSFLTPGPSFLTPRPYFGSVAASFAGAPPGHCWMGDTSTGALEW